MTTLNFFLVVVGTGIQKKDFTPALVILLEASFLVLNFSSK